MMSKEEREEIYNKAWKHYGPEMQLDIFIEEMAELIQAILKTRRNNVTYSHAMFEEFADVLICSEQLQTRLSLLGKDGQGETVFDQVLALRELKLLRLQQRLDDSIARHGEVIRDV